ncbi:MAG: FG-GAP-like repeat-containing protein, partial [Verrucomicrobiae bacterium]|nr:FG-GAP-like repeat-containing protein [Verrucomicrobiae bacterium]
MKTTKPIALVAVVTGLPWNRSTYPRAEQRNGHRRGVWLAAGLALVGQLASIAQTPPSVTGPTPAYQLVAVGVTVTYQVTISGTGPWTIQWRKHGQALEGKTSRVLNLANVQLSDTGNYDAVIANTWGAVTSQVARLEVDPTLPTFTKITSDPLVNEGKKDYRAVWGDYNGDGYLDVAIVGGYWASSAPSDSALYRNRGDGTFVAMAPNPFAPSTYGLCANWVDLENDGDLDLWVGVNEAYAPQCLVNKGDGTFNRLTASTNWIENGGKVRGGLQAWADYNGDGLVDVAVVPFGHSVATTLPISLLRNLGGGRLAVVTNSPLSEVAKESWSASWIDIDNDGDPDLICGCRSPAVFRNDNGTLIPVPEMDKPFASSNFYFDYYADFDNDGKLEVLVVTWSGRLQLWRNNSPAGWTLLEGPQYAALNQLYLPDGSGAVAWGDYDNDGDLDLFICAGNYGTTERNRMFINNGANGFVEAHTGSPTSDKQQLSLTCAWVDYDNDGFLDLHVVNSENWNVSGMNDYLYRNNGNSNHWLEVKPVGRLSNRAAIGAKVRVKALINGKEVWQLRLISAQAWTQELVAHFGLGDATQTELVRIEWPSGIVQELASVTANQILSVEEEVLAVESSVAETRPGTVEVPEGGSVTLSLTTVPANATLQWQFNGQAIEGATGPTLTIQGFSAANAGRYAVIATTPSLS